jgi:hypothetical protein
MRNAAHARRFPRPALACHSNARRKSRQNSSPRRPRRARSLPAESRDAARRAEGRDAAWGTASREELSHRACRLVPRRPLPRAARNERANDRRYDPTKPRSIPRNAPRASQMAREGDGQRAPVSPFPMPAPPERKSKTEEALEKARKPDCRTAYKDLGLLAAVPLIANEFGRRDLPW